MRKAAGKGVVQRTLLVVLGVSSLVAGLVGLLLPIMPTVPFVLLAAWCFARANPAWEARMLAHPHWGGHIRAWRERAAIPRRAKWLASAMLAISTAGTLLILGTPWKWGVAAVVLAVVIWMWSRPDA